MLWERWGHPPGESEYKSGFEEELALARARWTRDGQPEIWLFLKDIDPKLERDPGDQTKLVLAFRQRVREEQKLFYKEFRNSDEWTQEFRKRLSHYLVTLAAAKAEHSNPASSPIRPGGQGSQTSASLETDDKAIGPSAQQALASVHATAEAIKGGALGGFEVDLPSELTLARLILLTSTFQAARIKDELLGVHQANIVYRMRSQISPTRSEWLHLTKSMLSDQTQTLPGWAWTRPYAGFKDIVLHIAETDDTESVATGALRVVRELKIVPSAKDRRNLFTGILRTKHDSTLIEGLRWLEAYGAPSDSWFAANAREIASNDVRSAAEDAILAIKARHDPIEAFNELSASDHKYSETVVARAMKEFDTAQVQSALTHKLATVRQFAARELKNRKAITKPIVSSLVADSDSAVQRIGIEAAIELGEYPSFEVIRSAVKPNGLLAAVGASASSEADELIVEVLKSRPEPELRQKLDWFSSEGRLAYSALAQGHFQTFAPQLRADLSDKFASFQKRSSEAAIDRLGELGQRQVEAYERENLHEFIRSGFIRSAVAGLARHGSAEDRPLIDPLLADADYKLGPLIAEFLGRHGSPADAKTILGIHEKSWGSGASLLSLALRLSKNPSQLVLDNSLSKQTCAKIIPLLKDDQVLSLRSEWLTLLNDGNADIRKGIVLRIFAVTSADERRNLLDQLLNGTTYFYDTIYWLDRLSYPVKRWQVSFAESLAKHLANPYRKDWLRE